MKTSHSFILLFLITFVLGSFALSPKVSASGGPPSNCNTSEGYQALFNVTTGFDDTAFGGSALRSDTTGTDNTAVGCGALVSNTTASHNTATGSQALSRNMIGGDNTANGYQALFNNTEGVDNSAVGAQALKSNTGGSNNTASGANALGSNITGVDNTAVGAEALLSNTGDRNTALGFEAGFCVTTTSGRGNVYVGSEMFALPGESNHTYIRNINNTTVGGDGTAAVTVDLSTGLLGHLSSSRRYKDDIKPMDKTSERLFALKPVTFRYKKEIDQSQSLDYGLIAEQVAQVDPNLAVRDGKGQIESVRYNAINAMLLNEFLKEHKKVEEQQAAIAELKSTVAQQQKGMEAVTAQLKGQAAQIQKVSAQIELDNPAPRMAVNKP